MDLRKKPEQNLLLLEFTDQYYWCKSLSNATLKLDSLTAPHLTSDIHTSPTTFHHVSHHPTTLSLATDRLANNIAGILILVIC